MTANSRPKRKVTFFVSYARSNNQLAGRFVQSLVEALKPSKTYDYQLWSDEAILVGEQWQKEIANAIDNCDFGLLLLSQAFLGSQFIGEHELPHFIGPSAKPSVPVMLAPIDLERYDLKGLEASQIFRYKGQRYREARSYSKCNPEGRDEFVFSLFQEIEGRLGKM